MKRKRSLVGSIRLLTTFFLLTMSLFILCLELFIHSKDHSIDLVQKKDEYFEKQREQMEDEVERIIQRFDFQSQQVSEQTRKEVQARAEEGLTITRAIYDNGKNNKDAEVLQREILETLRLLSYRDGAGYYFVLNLEGVAMMNKAGPQIEGQNRLGVQDPKGKFFVKEMVDLAKDQGEGSVTYDWFKPLNREQTSTKISYLKEFEPYSWIIGTGLYEDDIKIELQSNLLSSIDYVMKGRDTSLFISPKKGPPLFGPDLRTQRIIDETGTEISLLTHLVDLSERGGGFTEYPVIKNGEIECQKLIYVKEIAQWDWIIGKILLSDDLEADLSEMIHQERVSLRMEISQILLLIFLFTLLLFIVLKVFNRYLKGDLSYFSSFLMQTAMKDIPLEKDKLLFREFSDLGDYANQMVEEKKKRDEEKIKLRNLESVGFLAGGLAHEFNNIFTGIYGNIELAKGVMGENPKAGEHLDTSLYSMDRAKKLTSQLLTFAKGGYPHLERLNLVSLLEICLKSSQLTQSSKVQINSIGEIPTIRGDRTQLSLALNNIFNNAHEAMAEGGEMIITLERVILNDLTNELEGDYVKISFTDRGKGINNENLERVFDPYYTTKQTGRGLGLTTVHSILRRHKGHIHINSSPLGTAVTLYLPCYPRE